MFGDVFLSVFGGLHKVVILFVVVEAVCVR